MENNLENVYLCGFGKVSIQSGIQVLTKKDSKEEVKMPFINIGFFNDTENRQIGKVEDSNFDVVKITKLLFNNIESLEVLQRAVNICRKELNSLNNSSS